MLDAGGQPADVVPGRRRGTCPPGAGCVAAVRGRLHELVVKPVDGVIAPRHADLRVFAVAGASTRVLPAPLTRVALEEGSLLVNSSRGGGSKDTWVPAG